eukprot:s2108_g8.t1
MQCRRAATNAPFSCEDIITRRMGDAMIAASGAATLKLPLSRKDISTWSSESKEWVLVDGTYTIFIGSSSRDIRATAKFTALDGEISFSAEESVPSEDV